MEAIEYQRMFAAEERHWWYVGLHDLIVRLVRAEATTAGHPLDILDAGCGTGRLCQLLQPFGKVTGCDIHPLALEATVSRGISSVLRRDLFSDDLGTGQYDLITCIDVLYHRAVPDEAPALRNLHRALRKGGLLILHLPAFELLRGTHDLAVHTRRRYRRPEIVRMLQSAGFNVKFASYRLFPLFLPLMLWRFWTRLFTALTGDRIPPSDLASPFSPLTSQLLVRSLKAENRFLTLPIPLPLGACVVALARKKDQKELPRQQNPHPSEPPMLEFRR